jgi:hypothetical protein
LECQCTPNSGPTRFQSYLTLVALIIPISWSRTMHRMCLVRKWTHLVSYDLIYKSLLIFIYTHTHTHTYFGT